MSKILVALTAITMLALLASHLHSGQVENKTKKVMFDNWMKRNGKFYVNEGEKDFRYAKYLENSAIV